MFKVELIMNSEKQKNTYLSLIANKFLPCPLTLFSPSFPILCYVPAICVYCYSIFIFLFAKLRGSIERNPGCWREQGVSRP